MNIDEAIVHCDEVINNCNIDECKLDHKQLKDWLIELKQLKEKIKLNYMEDSKKLNVEKNELDNMFDFDLTSNIKQVLENSFMPRKEKNIFYSISNGVCIKKDNKYVGFNVDKDKKVYPFEIQSGFVIKKIPVISIPCEIDNLLATDCIITNDNDLGRVIEIDKNNALVTYYDTNGNRLETRGIKNDLTGKVNFRKIISFSNFCNNNNNSGMNNMLPLLLMMKDDKQNDNDLKSLMMMQMFSQNNNGNMMQLFLMNKLFKDN